MTPPPFEVPVSTMFQTLGLVVLTIMILLVVLFPPPKEPR